jgi:hypothetical protein
VRAELRGERYRPPGDGDVAAMAAAEHRIPITVAAFCYGMACGVRLGRSFVPVPKRPRQIISEDWQRLHPNNRKTAARFIRSLLRVQEPEVTPVRNLPDRVTGKDAETARRWMREAGQRVRNEADDERRHWRVCGSRPMMGYPPQPQPCRYRDTSLWRGGVTGMDDTREWQGPERRTNLRLRALIDDLQSQLRDTRHTVECLRDGVSDLRLELAELRHAHNKGRPSAPPPNQGRQG